jgi:hypothetical protein
MVARFGYFVAEVEAAGAEGAGAAGAVEGEEAGAAESEASAFGVSVLVSGFPFSFFAPAPFA